MSDYWTRRAVTRRTALRGAGLGFVGLAGAALVGCGGDEEQPAAPAATAAATQAPAGAGTAAPTSTVVRQLGGEGIPVNPGTPKDGGTFTTAATSTYQQHDAHTALGPAVWHVIGEKALEIDAKSGEILPHMVDQYEVVDDTTLTLHLQPGIKIHDVPPWSGRDFTAEDLAWNLGRIAGFTADEEGVPLSSFQRASMVEGLDRAEAVDELNVRVIMKEPNSAFFRGLTENRMPLMQPEVVEIGFNDPMKFGGVGAFQMEAWEDGVSTSYKKFPNYFRAGEPHFDRYETIVVPDRASSLSAFISGEVHSFGGLQPHEIDTIKAAKPGVLIYEWADSNWLHFRPNMRYEPFRDYRVRRALQLATDVKEMGDGVYGSGWGYHAVLHPGYPEAWTAEEVSQMPGWNPDTKEADRAEAHKLLAAAGFPNGAGIDFETLYWEAFVSVAENALRMQDQMQTVFPELVYRVRSYPDLASFSKPQAESDFDGVSYVITATPDIVLEAISQFHSKGSRNYGKFNEPELDAILDKAKGQLDFNARTESMQEFQQRYIDEWMPIQVFYDHAAKNAIDGSIGGYDTTAGTWHGYSGLTKICRWYFVE